MKVFLVERKMENLKKIDTCGEVYRDTFEKNWDFLEKNMIRHHEKVTPKFVRRLELLEAMMFGFLNSAVDSTSLDFAEKMIYEMRG